MSGDAQLVERLYRELGPKLLIFLNRRHEATVAEDLLQETFARVVQHPDHLARSISPRAYLFGIARNLSVDAYRSTRPVEELSEDLVSTEEPLDPRLERMREAISRLKPAAREVLELRLEHELSYEETAEALGIPMGTVRSRLHHAVTDLRQALQESSPTYNRLLE